MALSNADKLLIARDTLRGQESDRYRISLLDEPGKAERLALYDANIARLEEEVASLEAAEAAETPAPVEEPEADPEA